MKMRVKDLREMLELMENQEAVLTKKQVIAIVEDFEEDVENEEYEICVGCQSVIALTEAEENADWLLEESDYTLDEGPHCGCCARKRRAKEL